MVMNFQTNHVDAIMRKDFGSFFRKVFVTLNPSTKYLHAPYIDLVTRKLQDLPDSKKRRLVLNLPPRHLKSTIVSVAYVAWLLGNNPCMRIMCISYSNDLAIRLAKETRQIMESAWYKRLFPGVVLDTSAQDLLTTTQNGERRALSVNGTITGFGADIIIIDDPQKAQEVNSEVMRSGSEELFRNTILTRLNDPEKGMVVLVQQRLHEDDWTGSVIHSGSWDHLSLPAIAEIDEKLPYGDKWFCRSVGDLLHPTRMSQDALNIIRSDMGQSGFSAQYQQRPVAPGGQILSIDSFRRFSGMPLLLPGDQIVHSWDLAYTVGASSDFSVCMEFLYRDHCLYLLHIQKVKRTYLDLRQLIITRAEKADIVVVEGGPTSALLCLELQRRNPLKFFPDVPRESKEVRLMKVCTLVVAGRVWLPTKGDFLLDFAHELSNFPNSKHDDQVDSFTQALRWVIIKKPLPPPEWMPPEFVAFPQAA
jgi:predicted phage terminase large subunit-like protein